MWNRIRALLERVASSHRTRAMVEYPEFGEALMGDRRLIDAAQHIDAWRSAQSPNSATALPAQHE